MEITPELEKMETTDEIPIARLLPGKGEIQLLNFDQLIKENPNHEDWATRVAEELVNHQRYTDEDGKTVYAVYATGNPYALEEQIEEFRAREEKNHVSR